MVFATADGRPESSSDSLQVFSTCPLSPRAGLVPLLQVWINFQRTGIALGTSDCSIEGTACVSQRLPVVTLYEA
jgi:hypothetical protein